MRHVAGRSLGQVLATIHQWPTVLTLTQHASRPRAAFGLSSRQAEALRSGETTARPLVVASKSLSKFRGADEAPYF
jgi:hypothetical protein